MTTKNKGMDSRYKHSGMTEEIRINPPYIPLFLRGDISKKAGLPRLQKALPRNDGTRQTPILAFPLEGGRK